MFPVLLSLGSYTVTTLGLFMVLSFVLALFVIWRIISGFEVDKEKTVDLFLLTSIISLLGARIYFVLTKPDLVSNPLNVILINRYPGFSFWGGFFSGLLSLYFITPKLKVNFWQILDFAFVGFLLGISLTSLGCLFNSCQYGLPSNLPIAVSQVGLVGKRFPLQIFESLLFFISFLFLWKQVLKFHINGSVAVKGLLILGSLKLLLEFFRGDAQKIFSFVSLGHIWSILTIILATWAYYLLTKRSFISDLRVFPKLFLNSSKRRQVLSGIQKSWYNLRVDMKVSLSRTKKRFFRNLNVKSNPPQF